MVGGIEEAVIQHLETLGLDEGLVALVSPSGAVLRCSAAAPERLGWPLAVITETPLQVVHPDDAARLAALDTTADGNDLVLRLARGDGQTVVYRFRWRWVESQTLGRVVWVHGDDITDQLACEGARALRAEALELAEVGVVAQDAAGALDVSPVARRILELEPGPIDAARLLALVTSVEQERVQRLSAGAANGLRAHATVHVELPSGPRELRLSLAPRRDLAGRPQGVLAVIQDTTDVAHLQARLRAAEQMSALGTLAAGVVHELNNPLSYVMANLHVVAAALEHLPRTPGVDVDDLLEAMGDAAEGTERMRQLVASLQAFTRAEHSTPAPVDVLPILSAVLTLAGNQTRHRARVVTRLESVPLVHGDAARLGSVFLNLILTSVASLEDGQAERNRLSISTGVDGPDVVITVSANSVGLLREELDGVFDPLSTTRALGSGPFVARSLVAALGGELTVASQPGEGTTFTVRLPAVRPDVELEGTVLAVGRVPVELRSWARILGDRWTVTMARSPAEVVDRVWNETFDCVLVDVPSLGEDARLVWEALPDKRRVGALVLPGTGLGPLAGRVEASLDKPFTAQALRALVERVAGPTGRGAFRGP